MPGDVGERQSWVLSLLAMPARNFHLPIADAGGGRGVPALVPAASSEDKEDKAGEVWCAAACTGEEQVMATPSRGSGTTGCPLTCPHLSLSKLRATRTLAQ